MKISPATLGVLAVGAVAVTGTAAITWYSVDQALEARKSQTEATDTEPSPVIEFGEQVLETWTWIGVKTGLIQPPPPACDGCGMG